jgi:hypothetical protein
MDEDTARSILDGAMQEYRRQPYQALADLVGQAGAREVRAPDGTGYQVEVQVLWDSKVGEALRVLGAIDDGRLRAFRPLTLDFIRNPDGSVAGE